MAKYEIGDIIKRKEPSFLNNELIKYKITHIVGYKYRIQLIDKEMTNHTYELIIEIDNAHHLELHKRGLKSILKEL